MIRRHRQFLLLILCGGISYMMITICRAARDAEFVYAARRGDRISVSSFLLQGVNPDANGFQDDTALHWASYEGDSNMVGLLISYGANPGAALLSAVKGGHIDVLNQLVNAKPIATRVQRAKAIEQATYMHRTDMIKVLEKSANMRDSIPRSTLFRR